MKKKDKQIYTAAAVVLIAAIVFVMMKNSGSDSVENTKGTEGQQTSNTQVTGQVPVKPAAESSTWTGILKLSDNAAKGNLMLATEQRNIYIRTSRDFSALVGKPVTVSYKGTLESFSLVDITLK